MDKIIRKYEDEGTDKSFRETIEALSTLISHERAEAVREERNEVIDGVISLIEGYFKGLIAIPDPQKTKERLTGYIYALKENGKSVEEYLKEEEK